ncbi:hypothetical protein [Candidatus Solirubrobacter pratensis]|uniref:hypothetical protein n=1 Tax=Candidatus Solirubrobacter pratensis TaxID=1298857 RepID=UPI0004869D57|nr:hypothetical protein [Candidatus Solirubrobacter pratensis]
MPARITLALAVLSLVVCEEASAASGLTTRRANQIVRSHLTDLGYYAPESYCHPEAPFSKSGRTRHQRLTCTFLAFFSREEWLADDTHTDCSGDYRVSWSRRKPGFKLRFLGGPDQRCTFGV